MANHDWEALYAQLDRATGAWERDELVGLLRDLIREYVIERGLPTGTPAQAATPDISSMDFPGLITWLKRASALPEMDLFQVDGRRVIVDADGPRELSLQRAAELRPRPAAPAQRNPKPATTPARPAPPARSQASNPPEQRPEPAGGRALGKGFRGLEFD